VRKPGHLSWAWFGLLGIDNLAVLSGLTSNTSNWPVLDFSSSARGPCTALFWAFDLPAHQLAALCESMIAPSTQLVKGYSVPARQLGKIGFLCIVMPNTRADCERRPPTPTYSPRDLLLGCISSSLLLSLLCFASLPLPPPLSPLPPRLLRSFRHRPAVARSGF
jgi:hypothetical protein